MKNTIIKILITILLLPVFLSLAPGALASEIHGLQHDSNRVAGTHHAGHLSNGHAHSEHEHPAFSHSKSASHPLILDLSTYFNEYLNVDLRSSTESIADLDEVSGDIWLFLLSAVSSSFSNRVHVGDRHPVYVNETRHLRSVLSLTKRLRI